MKIRKSDVGRFVKVWRINNPKKTFRGIIVEGNEFNDEMFDVFDIGKKKVVQIDIDQIISIGSQVKLPTKSSFRPFSSILGPFPLSDLFPTK